MVSEREKIVMGEKGEKGDSGMQGLAGRDGEDGKGLTPEQERLLEKLPQALRGFAVLPWWVQLLTFVGTITISAIVSALLITGIA